MGDAGDGARAGARVRATDALELLLLLLMLLGDRGAQKLVQLLTHQTADMPNETSTDATAAADGGGGGGGSDPSSASAAFSTRAVTHHRNAPPSLRVLQLDRCNLGGTGMAALFRSPVLRMEWSRSLCRLALNRNPLGTTGSAALVSE